MSYRNFPPPAPVVTLGPLRFEPAHFIAPALFIVIGLALVGAAVASVVIAPTPASLRCTRGPDQITCEHWSAGRLVRTLEGAAPSYRRLGGRYPKDCIAFDDELVCGGDARRGAATLNRLALGGSATVDVTESRSVMGTLVGALFGVALLTMAGAWIHSALGRRRVSVIRVTPHALEVAGAATIPRGVSEEVRVVRIGGGRGVYPVWAIDYGHHAAAERLGTWMSFRAIELEPFAAALRHALAQTHPQGSGAAAAHMRRT